MAPTLWLFFILLIMIMLIFTNSFIYFNKHISLVTANMEKTNKENSWKW